MINSFINEISCEYLKDTELGTTIQVAMNSFRKAQEALMANEYDQSSDLTKRIRVGTVLTFAILSKVSKGKSIKKFTPVDWNEVAASVVEYAVIQGDERYSIAIFNAYANYVDASVMILDKRGVSAEKCDAIRMTAEQVRLLTAKFQAGEIKETDYTEECLWLLLEAMIKLLSTYATAMMDVDKAEFIQSSAMLAFEYGRYKLYKQEQEILTLYLENQCRLNEELEAKLAEYKAELEKRQDEFNDLISDAFSDDFTVRLKSSAKLAEEIGVDKMDILDSIDSVDDFFL